jgi:hypothetical protein
MQSFRAFLALLVLGVVCTENAPAQTRFGPQGPESEPDRKQQWLVPSPDTDIRAHALLFRPPGDGPFWLAVIGHASTQNVLRRAQMPQPEYRALTARKVTLTLSRQLADAFRRSGGRVNFRLLAASGSEGHWLPETGSGVKIAAPALDRALKLRPPTEAKER